MANRGIVKYSEAEDQVVDTVPEKGYFLRLIDIILINLNERDSYNRAQNAGAIDASKLAEAQNTYTQLSGIEKTSDRTTLENAKFNLNNGVNLPASDANTIIKYTEELVNSVAISTTQVKYITCTYPRESTIVPTDDYEFPTGTKLIVATKEDTELDVDFTVPEGVNVLKIEPYNMSILDAGSTFKLYQEVYEESTTSQIVVYDSSDPNQQSSVYVYVDSGESLELTGEYTTTSKYITGTGIKISYSQEINYTTPTVNLSEDFVLDVESGSSSYSIPASGSTTVSFTVPDNINTIAIGDGYHGNALHVTDADSVEWCNYPTKPTKLPSYVAVTAGEEYTLTVSGTALTSFDISYSKDINFHMPDIFTGSYSASTVNLCSNLNISCPNRQYRYGYKDQASATEPGYVILCTSSSRPITVTAGAGNLAITRVNSGEIVYASTWTYIAQYLRQVSSAMDKWKISWTDNGRCNLTCMTACQTACQLTCQRCFGGTCHNQHCGGIA